MPTCRSCEQSNLPLDHHSWEPQLGELLIALSALSRNLGPCSPLNVSRSLCGAGQTEPDRSRSVALLGFSIVQFKSVQTGVNSPQQDLLGHSKGNRQQHRNGMSTVLWGARAPDKRVLQQAPSPLGASNHTAQAQVSAHSTSNQESLL